MANSKERDATNNSVKRVTLANVLSELKAVPHTASLDYVIKTVIALQSFQPETVNFAFNEAVNNGTDLFDAASSDICEAAPHFFDRVRALLDLKQRIDGDYILSVDALMDSEIVYTVRADIKELAKHFFDEDLSKLNERKFIKRAALNYMSMLNSLGILGTCDYYPHIHALNAQYVEVISDNSNLDPAEVYGIFDDVYAHYEVVDQDPLAAKELRAEQLFLYSHLSDPDALKEESQEAEDADRQELLNQDISRLDKSLKDAGIYHMLAKTDFYKIFAEIRAMAHVSFKDEQEAVYCAQALTYGFKAKLISVEEISDSKLIRNLQHDFVLAVRHAGAAYANAVTDAAYTIFEEVEASND